MFVLKRFIQIIFRFMSIKKRSSISISYNKTLSNGEVLSM